MTLEVDVRLVRGDFELDVSFEAADGETVALIGPNGSGKSTLVAVLAGLLSPDGGVIRLDGRTFDDETAHLTPQERRAGAVFQDPLLFPHLNAVENVAFALRARGVPKFEARRRALEMLDRFGVGHRASARPGHLSGGEIQRVALARALIAEPDLLLLDEPTASLDARAHTQFRPLLARTIRSFPGICIFVTHDPIEAMTLGHRILVLEDGRVTQTGTPDEIRRTPRTTYAADVVGVNLFSGRLERLPDGTGRIVTANGDITVAWPQRTSSPVDGVVAILRPADVTLHRTPPEGSARNAVEGRIAEVAIEAERARVRLDSRPPLVAEVTIGSVRRLGLQEGGEAWASFKAVEVRLVLPSESAPSTLSR